MNIEYFTEYLQHCFLLLFEYIFERLHDAPGCPCFDTCNFITEYGLTNINAQQILDIVRTVSVSLKKSRQIKYTGILK